MILMVASRREVTEMALGGKTGHFMSPPPIQTHTHRHLVPPLHLKNDTREDGGEKEEEEDAGWKRDMQANKHKHLSTHMYN